MEREFMIYSACMWVADVLEPTQRCRMRTHKSLLDIAYASAVETADLLELCAQLELLRKDVVESSTSYFYPLTSHLLTSSSVPSRSSVPSG
jgi:hypothetical protein